MFGGSVNAGAFVSWTVTVKLAVPVLCEASVAEHCTVVAPSGNVLPDAGVQDTTGAASTRSVAVALNVAVTPLGPVASSVWLVGGVTTGGVVSTTCTTKVVAVAAFP